MLFALSWSLFVWNTVCVCVCRGGVTASASRCFLIVCVTFVCSRLKAKQHAFKVRLRGTQTSVIRHGAEGRRQSGDVKMAERRGRQQGTHLAGNFNSHSTPVLLMCPLPNLNAWFCRIALRVCCENSLNIMRLKVWRRRSRRRRRRRGRGVVFVERWGISLRLGGAD